MGDGITCSRVSPLHKQKLHLIHLMSMCTPDSRVVTSLNLSTMLLLRLITSCYSYTSCNCKYQYRNIVHLYGIYLFPQKEISAVVFYSYELLLPLDG